MIESVSSVVSGVGGSGLTFARFLLLVVQFGQTECPQLNEVGNAGFSELVGVD